MSATSWRPRADDLVHHARALPLLLAVGCGERNPASAPGPVVREAWSRPALQGTTGVAYLTIENADTLDLHLTRISSPLATGARLHESAMEGNITTMAPRPDVAIVRGATVAMRPGGLHVMLMELRRALQPGDSVPLTLEFADGRRVQATAVVRE